MSNAATLETPKKVMTDSDWLHCNKEVGQPIKRYMNGSPDINWLNSRNNKLILLVIDDSISEETQQKLLTFCKAFYTGVNVTLVRPGATLKKDGKNVKVPTDFLGTHNIASRLNPCSMTHQLHAGQILDALTSYKSLSTLGILGVTN